MRLDFRRHRRDQRRQFLVRGLAALDPQHWFVCHGDTNGAVSDCASAFLVESR
jgi:hypothetical protein